MRDIVSPAHTLRRRMGPRLLALLLCALPAVVSARDPEMLYMLECQGCHLSDGHGGLDAIPVLEDNVARFPTIPGGREYLVQVPGVALAPLSDEELTDVLNWMLHKFGPVAATRQYPPYTVDEVATLRRQPLLEVARKRAELVDLMTDTAEPDAKR